MPMLVRDFVSKAFDLLSPGLRLTPVPELPAVDT